MKTGTITSKQLTGKCPNGHRLCLSARCWLATPKPRHKPDAELWCEYCGQLVPDAAADDPCPASVHPNSGWWDEHGPAHRGFCMQCTSPEELAHIQSDGRDSAKGGTYKP